MSKETINSEQASAMILKAVPSFQKTWDAHENQDLLYVVMGDLAHHLLKLYRGGQTDEISELCIVIEHLALEGDDTLKELVTIGLLESVQNVWANKKADPDAFAGFLLPESMKRWRELNDFWEGNIN